MHSGIALVLQSLYYSSNSVSWAAGKSKRPSARKQWLANIKRGGELSKEEHFVICSQHFDEDCFERDLKISIACISTACF